MVLVCNSSMSPLSYNQVQRCIRGRRIHVSTSLVRCIPAVNGWFRVASMWGVVLSYMRDASFGTVVYTSRR